MGPLEGSIEYEIWGSRSGKNFDYGLSGWHHVVSGAVTNVSEEHAVSMLKVD
jgi:hypothetical protein